MKSRFRIIWYCLLVLVCSLVFGVLGLLFGVEVSGNYAFGFSWWGLVGYELIGVIGSLLGVGVGCFASQLIARRIWKGEFWLASGVIGCLLGLALDFMLYTSVGSWFLGVVILLLPVIGTVVGSLLVKRTLHNSIFYSQSS